MQQSTQSSAVKISIGSSEFRAPRPAQSQELPIIPFQNLPHDDVQAMEAWFHRARSSKERVVTGSKEEREAMVLCLMRCFDELDAALAPYRARPQFSHALASWSRYTNPLAVTLVEKLEGNDQQFLSCGKILGQVKQLSSRFADRGGNPVTPVANRIESLLGCILNQFADRQLDKACAAERRDVPAGRTLGRRASHLARISRSAV